VTSVHTLTACSAPCTDPPGSPTQKYITTYAMSPNRQRPFAGAMRAAVFNTARRVRGQILYIVPPMLIMYGILDWSVKRYIHRKWLRATVADCNRNHYLNSKAGRAEVGDSEE